MAGKFLSTPSARRATPCIETLLRVASISIHALREEGDPTSMHSSRADWIFLSTPSARRATAGGLSGTTYQNYFYPRPPRGGRLPCIETLLCVASISIHALREEGDQCSQSKRLGTKKFLSTPSARRATRPSTETERPKMNFYPRPPRGGRHNCQTHDKAMFGISIHALREEGDSKNRDKISIFKQIIQHSARI